MTVLIVQVPLQSGFHLALLQWTSFGTAGVPAKRFGRQMLSGCLGNSAVHAKTMWPHLLLSESRCR